MNHYDNCKPCPIPRREQFPHNYMSPAWSPINSKVGGFNHEPFAEIEIDQPYTIGDPVPPAQSVNLEVDDKRTLFYSMRQIARDYLDHANTAKAFYHQAQFMKDFKDEYEEREPFSCYYPYYHQMGYEQLRTYFTWRTQVRKGDITDTSVSYAFLYIYELLNNIGVTDPEDGFDKLITFWQTFRTFNSMIDRYVLQWSKDYHVYYPMQHSFQDFVNDHHLQMHYPTVFGYESGRHDSFDVFVGISKYNIKKSIFYTEQTRQLLCDCFYFILHRFRTLCGIKGKCFEDFVFCPLENESTWTPFSRALFYPALKQPDRQVVISEREIYRCSEQNRWTYRTVILTENGKQLIGYIMKEMEANLRKAVKFKHNIRADLDMCDSQTRKKFDEMEISLPQLIQKSVAEFYARYTRKEVSVDTDNLMRIREEALSIQEKLIVPEDVDTHEKEANSDGIAAVLPVSDIWTGFRTELTQTEFEALTIILRKDDIKGFACNKGIMLEVLVDSINQKAADYIGDTVLDIGDSVTVYDDYRERLIGILQ